MGRLEILSTQWNKTTLCPLPKICSEEEAAKYRPVSMISHVPHIIDGGILSMVCESLLQARSQFGFQATVSMQQSILRAQYNVKQGLNHMTVMISSKPYDKVDRALLLGTLTECLNAAVFGMVRATLAPSTVRTREIRLATQR